MSSEQEIRNKRAREYYHRNKAEIKERNNERSKQYYKEHKSVFMLGMLTLRIDV